MQVSPKLASLTLKGCDTLILAAESVSHDEQPQALRDALPHLQPLHTPGIELQLDFFLLNRAVTAELCGLEAAGWGKLSLAGADWGMRHPAPPASAPLPPLNYLNLTDYTLDNSLLQDLVQWCPVVRWLVVENVALSGPLPEGCVVPWEVVGVEECMSVSDWLQQSEWVGGIVQWELGALRICLQPEEVCWLTHTYIHGEDMYAGLISYLSAYVACRVFTHAHEHTDCISIQTSITRAPSVTQTSIGQTDRHQLRVLWHGLWYALHTGSDGRAPPPSPAPQDGTHHQTREGHSVCG